MAEQKKNPIQAQPKQAKPQGAASAKPAVKQPEHKPAAKPIPGMPGKGK
jgi:hypothetical protein